MAQFRKKPIVVEAAQYLGRTFDKTELPAGVCVAPKGTTFSCIDQPHIHTLNGVMIVKPGDWIIKGVAGEFYPCKPDIFAATYELVK